MARFSTNSWQAREALVNRTPFTTYGGLSATYRSRLPFGHRLPAEWVQRYKERYDHIAYVVWSYATPIAWVYDDGRVVKVDHKWSMTTTKHQGMLYALDASEGTRNGIADAAQRERQQQKDRRADARDAAELARSRVRMGL